MAKAKSAQGGQPEGLIRTKFPETWIWQCERVGYVLLIGTVLFEPRQGKTRNVVSEQVRDKPACTVTEKGLKLEILDIRRREIALFVYTANTKALIRFEVTAKLACAFVFA